MPGRIEIYLDVGNYIAFKQVIDTWSTLEAHGVEIDIKPVLLGAINAATGNKPPFSVPAKGKYGIYDGDRSQKAAGLPEITFPDDLIAISRTQIPLRALHYVKATYPRETYLTTWHYLLHALWSPEKQNISDAGVLAKVLAAAPKGFRGPGSVNAQEGGHRLFSESEVAAIMKAASEEQWKDALKQSVEEALKRGAFGAPWLWVTNDKGHGEPFFGSDRWHFVYEFLGLPHQKLKLLGPEGGAKL
ncbi:hypothetical protein PFICI_07530 [Pestalotiopsis fici W106-1]|uniref:Uncharacterized protein n=1 Tax=Pestalotiopsis fici (strain W106-1 / CGMCC3.15140) TaxID=1229662 RepID=W3X4A0_PESFW|nr:uncharacterized protein PFICI_07530 [Pestalotiopsis fici W106-1]ETS80001.1 hypothetical protein PFICI_07530 [Pestalotiopsis fici W106-1]